MGKILAGPDVSPSPVLELLRVERRNARGFPWLAFAEKAPGPGDGRSLWDVENLGVLEWGAAAVDLEGAAAVLAEVEERLAANLARCQLSLLRADGVGSERQWAFLAAEGPSRFLRCDQCGYLAERDSARFELPSSADSTPGTLREVDTPGASTIKILCDQLGINPAATLKALFLTADGETLLALLRGDLEASMTKLSCGLGAHTLRPAEPEEIERLGVVAGYAGPVGLTVRLDRHGQGVWVVADRSIAASANLVAGANHEGFHLLGVNYPRDFAVTEVVDFARAPRRASCADCGGGLAEEKGLILARRRTFAGGFDLASGDGEALPGAMLSLQLSLGALTAAVLAAARREPGFMFPWACAPFHVHLLQLAGGPDVSPAVDELNDRGLDILIDDRDLSAGIKFAESEWIGSPVRIVAGRKSYDAGGVEVTTASGETRLVRLDELVESVLAENDEVM
jgi:prolyl-tRNA synthetase